MNTSGIFVVLYDDQTLSLYLREGVYGFLMAPVYGPISNRSRHYHALGDYSCIRKGTHVFFFLRRKIIYGGQVSFPNDNVGAFYINGSFSPLGKNANAQIYWDESKRACYTSTNIPGIFKLPNSEAEKCQPYLILFDDHLKLKGKSIISDQLYFELGKYPYPLPTNTTSNMSFCTMTPGEVNTLLKLLRNSKETFSFENEEDVRLSGDPIPFSPKYGFQDIKTAMKNAQSEAHLEAFILANPEILPIDLQPSKTDTLCRQVPMSPFKPPKWLDKANICIYKEPYIKDGTIPNIIIELKINPIRKNDIEQAIKYLKWIDMIAEKRASEIIVYLCGPAINLSVNQNLYDEYKDRLKIIELYN